MFWQQHALRNWSCYRTGRFFVITNSSISSNVMKMNKIPPPKGIVTDVIDRRKCCGDTFGMTYARTTTLVSDNECQRGEIHHKPFCRSVAAERSINSACSNTSQKRSQHDSSAYVKIKQWRMRRWPNRTPANAASTNRWWALARTANANTVKITPTENRAMCQNWRILRRLRVNLNAKSAWRRNVDSESANVKLNIEIPNER